MIEDTKEAVGATCAVPVRIAMNEFQGAAGLEPAEVEDAIAMMAELPDLWDLSLSSWAKDSQTSRFSEEGFQEPYIKGVKKLTTEAGGRRGPLHLARHHGAGRSGRASWT